MPASARPYAPLTSPASTAPPGWPAAPPRSPTRSRTATAPTGWRSPSRRWCPRTPGQRAQRRLDDNKRFAARNTKVPSLLQGLAACAGCGYAYYRGHTTTTAGNKIYYYRCLGSDNYRYEHGRVCDNKPVRTDHLDKVVWDHITGLLADPELIRAEIDRRLDQLRTADPTTSQQQRLQQALAKATASITRLIKAYQEELISLDELRERTPELRARETSLRSQLDALAAQLVDRDAYLKLAENLEGFLARLRDNAATATVRRAAARAAPARQRRPHRPRTHPHPPLHPDRRQQHLPDHKDHRR